MPSNYARPLPIMFPFGGLEFGRFWNIRPIVIESTHDGGHGSFRIPVLLGLGFLTLLKPG